jgi:hypothetical protein
MHKTPKTSLTECLGMCSAHFVHASGRVERDALLALEDATEIAHNRDVILPRQENSE